MTRNPTKPPKLFRQVMLDGKGHALQATRDIKPGERILAEEPLIALTPIPSDVIYRNHWLKTTTRRGETLANGRETFAADIKKLQRKTKNRFRKLHGTSPRSDDRDYSSSDEGYRNHELERIRLNAFNHPQKKGDLEYQVERVFDLISRINYSCKPNAVMSWNEKIGQGTVHAITAISDAEEITINYCPNPEMEYRSIKDRCTYLLTMYGFVCTCPACGPEPRLEHKARETAPQGKPGTRSRKVAHQETDDEEDMRLRLQLKGLYARIQWDEVPTKVNSVDGEQIEADRLEQLERLEEYITIMKSLGMRDSKLADAHETKAKYLELGMHTANLRSELGDEATPDNLPNDPPEDFLRWSREQWDLCHSVHLRCSGEDHTNTQSADTNITRVKLQLIQFEE